MARSGLVPSNVFMMRMPHHEVYKRTHKDSVESFECNRSIVAEKLRFADANIPHVL